ncbi:DUF11 domain-containing protein [Alphaproteobacteria bacterium KMM 3653]|uniref:DUF11 domain-containing protein n=1 Tax=Harenicola maris TaxID=2841044 RepID=A0AAP2CRF9_9RHOB|nr:DUF11 domain-containing protein [Harenicola maris]
MSGKNGKIRAVEILAQFGRASGGLLRGWMACVSMVFALCWAQGAAAQSFDYDWLVNVDETVTPAPAGGVIEVPINILNFGFGPDPAPATTIEITVPPTTSFVSFSSDDVTGCAPLPAAAGEIVTCQVPSLAFNGQPGDSVDLLFGIETTQQGAVPFTANVPEVDNDTGNNSQTKNLTLTQGADLEVTVDGPVTATSGETVDYTFTVANNGPDDASGSVLTIPVPSGFANLEPPVGCVLDGAVYECTIPGPLAEGESVDFVFGAQIVAAAPSTVSWVGSVGGGSPDDPDTENNTATFDTSVEEGSDLALTKVISPPETLLVGDQAVFTLSPTYSGNPPEVVTLEDSLPSNYTVDSVDAPAPWDCEIIGSQQVTCEHPGGASSGADVPLGDIEITANVVTAGSAVENTAEIDAEGPIDPNPDNNIASDGGVEIEDKFVDLRANKTGPQPALVVLGSPFDFQISSTNIGNEPFFGTITMVDTLPAGLEVLSYDANGWDCSPAAPVVAGGEITCTIEILESAPLGVDDRSPVVTLETVALVEGALENGLEISASDSNLPDENAPNDIITYSVTSDAPLESADVSIVKTASEASLAAGETQTFELEIINEGPNVSNTVQVRDLIGDLINNTTTGANPALLSIGYANISETDANCSTTPSGATGILFGCDIATLPVCLPGATCPVVTIEVVPGGEAGRYFNTATITSYGTADPDRSNETSTVGYDVDARVDITITKVASAAVMPAGQNLTYLISGINKANGLSTAENLTITDVLPDDLTFVSATPSTGSCGTTPTPETTTTTGNNTIICNLGDVANGAEQNVSVVVRPNNELAGSDFVNDASVSTDTTQIGIGDEDDSVPVSVSEPTLDLLVQKTESIDPLPLDGTTVFTVTVRNLGPSASQNIVVTDSLPISGLEFVSATALDGGTCPTPPAGPAVGSLGETLVCTFDYLPAGGSARIQVEMKGVSKGTASNSVEISSDEILAGQDTVTGNNSVTETTSVRTRTDVSVDSKVASPNPVNLRDPFDFTIRVAVNVGAGLVEADDTVVTDNLPAGLELTGTPTLNLVQGAISAGSACTGVAEDTSFTCDLGTFEQESATEPGYVDITVPVRALTVSSDPQTFTNTASIATSSFELGADRNNNSNSGPVTVNASTITGKVFGDFNDDGVIDTGDTNVGGVPISLIGYALDGTEYILNTTTDGNGNYSFGLLPEGTYTITRGTVPNDTYLEQGGSYPDGTNGTGEPDGGTVIADVVLGGDSTAANNNFTVVPIARVGIAKRANGAPVINADGSFDQVFSFVVENFSDEALEDVVVSDTLAGGAPAFGTLGTAPLAAGEYLVLAAPTGSCGGKNAAFDGSGDPVLAEAFTIALQSACTLNVTLRVQPTIPLPPIIEGTDRYQNQASVEGTGALSGQTSATNPFLSDVSDDGTNADPSNNGSGDGANDNDPTLMGPVFTPSIALIKTVSTDELQDPPMEGDFLTYTFSVTNTGPIDLQNVTISDDLDGIILEGGPILTLGAGDTDTDTFTARYALKQSDIDLGEVENTATASGADIYGTVAEDDSGTANNNDTPTLAEIEQVISLAIVKTADDSGVSDPAVDGETITYGFNVINTGNVTLTDVTVTDPLDGIELTGAPIPTLLPGVEVINAYTGSYDYDLDDINAGEVENQATATGKDPLDNDVTDLSGETYEDDNPIVVPLVQDPQIALIKTSTSDRLGTPPQEGDELDFQFTVTNTGNVTLTGITISDLLDGIVLDGGPIDLDPGEFDSDTFTATYPLTQDDLDLGLVENTATVSGNPPLGADPVTDDSGADNETDAPLETPLTQVATINLTKQADASAVQDPPQEGDTITYTFVIENTGNQTLTDIAISDNDLQDLEGNSRDLTSGPEWVNPGGGAVEGVLAPGDSYSYTATYDIVTGDIDAAGVVNVATVAATDPRDVPVGDISDDPLDDENVDANGDDNPDDPTETPLARAPALVVTKTDNIDGLLMPVEEGDVITYTILVTNTGNVTLSDLTLTDELVNDDDDTYDLSDDLVFVEGSLGSLEGDLQVGEVATYTLDYELLLADVDSGAVENSVTATGTSPDGTTEVDDISDDPDAGPAGEDDPTRTAFEPEPSLSVLKTDDLTAFEEPTLEGNIITYTITVLNTGNVTLSDVTLTDGLSNFAPTPSAVDLSADIAFVSADQDSPLGTIEPGETATYTLEYALTQEDIDYGGVENTVTATGVDPFETVVEDVSDDPAETADVDPNGDDNPDDPTVSPVTAVPGMNVLKVADTSGLTTPAAPGQVIKYTVTVTNTGNTTLLGVALSDEATDGVGGSLTLTPPVPAFDSADRDSAEGTLLVGETATYLAELVLTQDIINTASVTNTATGSGASPTGVEVEDVSDDPADPSDVDPNEDGNPDDPTYTPLAAPELVVLKVDDTSALSSPPVAGEVVTYTITVENTGNVPLTSVALVDTLVNDAGTPDIALSEGPTWQSSNNGSGEGALALFETATYTGSYTITQEDINSGGLLNTVTASAIDPTDTPVEDTSDDPDVTDDVDANDDGEPDDPTPTPLPRAPSLDITKTTADVTQVFPFVYDVTYDIAVENTGNTTANFVQVEDDLAAAMTPGVIMGVPELEVAGFGGTGTVNAAYDGISDVNMLSGDTVLQPDEIGTIQVVVRVNFVAGLTTQTNTAYATSSDVTTPVASDDPVQTPEDEGDTNPTPPPVVDDELDGSPDGFEGTGDRDGDGIVDNADFDPLGYFYCQETGAILPGGLITVTGPAGSQTGVGTSNNITIVTDGSDGSFQWFVSAPGVYTMTYVLPTTGVASDDRFPGGTIDVTSFLPTNPVSLGGSEVGSTGQLSDFTADGNPFYVVFDIAEGDPTIFNNNIPLQYCGMPAVTASKEQIGDPILTGDQRTQLVYQLSSENTGETRVADATLVDDLDAAFGEGTHEVLAIELISAPDTFGAAENAAYDGAADANLLTAGGILEPGEEVTVQITIAVAVEAAGNFTNTVVAGGASPLDGTPVEESSATSSVDLLPPPDTDALLVTKTAGVGSARLGDPIPYSITFENTQPSDFVGLTLVDQLPAGLVYQPGSAAIDGVAIEPVVFGRRLTWPDQDIMGLSTITLTFVAIVGPGADPDQFVNTSWIEDPETGNIISNVSEAIVEREIEAVFDCSDVIGTVFDDLNHNGYQDGPYDPETGLITDQNVYTGKAGKLEVPAAPSRFDGEPGLAGVRLSTDTGTLITTDAHGRFNVPCAALPGRFGENFTLKLDTRTLPSGYRVTTENPRTIRLTAGKFAKLNFGASISHIIDIDLSARAFEAGSNDPKASLVTGIGGLLDQMKDKPSVLRVSYFENGEDRAVVRRRLDRVETMIRREWRRRNTRYKLSIERTIKRLQ